MKIYIFVESMYGGANASVYKTLSQAKKALRNTYKDILVSIQREPYENYCTGINAIIKTDDLEDYWYGVIQECEI